MADFATQVGPGWAEALEPVRPDIERMGQFLRDELRAGRRFLPAGERVFAAFRAPLDAVKVLIVGQDPYPTPGHPIGLCFATAAHVRPLPKSLQNIFTEYRDDLGLPPPNSGDLTPWVDQGVMLLNRCLTVRPGQPASHRGKGWEAVTERAISVMGQVVDAYAANQLEQPMEKVLRGTLKGILKYALTYHDIFVPILLRAPAFGEASIAGHLEGTLTKAVQTYMNGNRHRYRVRGGESAIYVMINSGIYTVLKWLIEQPQHVSRDDLIDTLTLQMTSNIAEVEPS